MTHILKEAVMAKSRTTDRPGSSAARAPKGTAAPEANRPVHTIRYRGIKAAIWRNESPEKGAFYSVTLSRSWQDDAQVWHDASNFGFNDLTTLAKAATDCHTWIAWTERRERESRESASEGREHAKAK
jgi:hypothetical protein